METEVRSRPRPEGASRTPSEGAGMLVFEGVMVMVAGTLNVVYGIAAIDNARFFVNDAAFVFSDLETWGWILLALGVLQISAALSIWQGGSYGRWFGIFVAGVSAIGALLSLPAYPFLSLALFAVDIIIIHALATYGGKGRTV